MDAIDIELSGQKLKLSQRSIRDIIDASLFDENKEKTEDRIFLNAFIIHSALKANLWGYNDIKFWQLKRKKEKKKIEKIISVENIMQSVSFIRMNELCSKIYELDFGIDSVSAAKKKAEVNQQI